MSAGTWWLDAVAGLGAPLLRLPLLPLRLLGLGLEALAGLAPPAAAALQAPAPGSGWPSAVPVPAGGRRWTAGDGWQRDAWPEAEEPPPAAGGGWRWTEEPLPAASGPWRGAACAAPDAAWPPAGQAASGGAAGDGAAVGTPEVKVKEDRTMTCCCDQNLNGCELKIVTYSVVSVDPELDSDAERIILPEHTIATSSDMTPADFTAYVIASQRGANREKLERYDPEYLRVCYQVLCRFPLPCVDYEKEQAQALRAINRTLRDKDHRHLESSSSSQELAPAEPKKGPR